MIYPQTGLSLILCPAQNHEIITQDQGSDVITQE